MPDIKYNTPNKNEGINVAMKVEPINLHKFEGNLL